MLVKSATGECVCVSVMQASATRSQDEQYYASQQGTLSQQLAELTLRAAKYGGECTEDAEGLRKKRLKLQQEVEVSPTVPDYALLYACQLIHTALLSSCGCMAWLSAEHKPF